MIISGLEIKNMLNKEIFIEPFDDSRLNPNSYNLRLHNELLVYDSHVLDMKVKNETKTGLLYTSLHLRYFRSFRY